MHFVFSLPFSDNFNPGKVSPHPTFTETSTEWHIDLIHCNDKFMSFNIFENLIWTAQVRSWTKSALDSYKRSHMMDCDRMAH